MQAVVLAGGEGTRMRPLTAEVAKPVMPLAGRPFLLFMLDWLVEHGVEDVVVCCGYAADRVAAVLKSRYRSARLRYVREQSPLDTAGPVRLAADQGLLDERFFVLNGDILCDFDLSSQLEWHMQAGAACTLALVAVEDSSSYGTVVCDAAGRVEGFFEKQARFAPGRVNAGIYVAERAVAEQIAPDRPVSFESEIFPRLASSRQLYGYFGEGYWNDIGTPERYLEATRDLLCERIAADLPSLSRSQSVIYEPVSLDGASIGPLSVVGRRCAVGAESTVQRSVLFDGVTVGGRCFIVDSILADGVAIADGARVGPGAVVGHDAKLRAGSVVEPGARIEPGTWV